MARVFLCDDSESFRLLVRLELEQRGHEVVGEAADGRACEERMPGTSPDVLVMDHTLPHPVRPDVLREACPETRLVLFSGLPQDMLEREASAQLADAALTKAATFDELDELVRRVSA